MKLRKTIIITIIMLLASALILSACGKADEKAKVKVLVVPKFESGEIKGDFPGEAQLFYERYFEGCEEIDIPHANPATVFYYNKENEMGMLIAGAGKTATSLSLMALLSCDSYDFSDTTIISIGCAGGCTGRCTLGDVVLVTAACDYDLGHSTDSSDLKYPDQGHTWFPDDSYSDFNCKRMNPELYEKYYPLIKDCPVQTTEKTKDFLAERFPNDEWALRDPCVMKGTAITSDSFWKGQRDHENAEYIAEYYKCDDKYAVTEMEELAVMNTAACFGMEDCVISLRVVVNTDTFFDGESPEQMWLKQDGYNEKVEQENSETLDIFETGMHNLFDVASIIVDDILDDHS